MGLTSRGLSGRLPLGLLGALAIMAACESYIAAHELIFSDMATDDWRQAGRVAAGGLPTGGVLFFGDSQVKHGFSPLAIESRLRQPVQSLAISGGQAATSYFLLRRALDSGAMPLAVVVDFAPHLLRDRNRHDSRIWAGLADLGEIVELSWANRDADGLARMAIGRVLPSYRLRPGLRDVLMTGLRGEPPTWLSKVEAARRNRGMNRGAVVVARNRLAPRHDDDVSIWGMDGWAPWSANPANDAYARKFMALARDRGIPVYCVLMPVDPSLQAIHEASGLQGHYAGWLARLQAEFPNMYVLDWSRARYPSTALADALHLNSEGVAATSVALGEHLARAIRGDGVGARWVAMPEYKEPGGAELVAEDFDVSDQIMRATAPRRRR